ncbi:MAG: hypothetical protein ABIR18_08850 [Chitinophagaceae bacterium]
MKNIWLILVLILAGCTTTQITSTWRNPEPLPVTVDPILIIGVMNEQDSNLCRKMEERFAASLNTLGYHAASSISEYGANAFDALNEEEPFKFLYRTRFKTIITIELLNKETVAFPKPVWLETDVDWFNHPFRDQKPGVNNISALQTRYLWESNYYDMNQILLMYTVNSKSDEPSSNKKMSQEYSKIIIDNMVKSGLLKKEIVPLKAF